MQTVTPSPPEAFRDWPSFWFIRLELALEVGDFQAAADAQQQLARLGVRVTFSFPRTPETEAQQCRA